MSHFTSLLDGWSPDAQGPTHQGPARLPVVVLTGFLGSGKTTLVNALLTMPASPDAAPLQGVAVIVNEFGEVGIDQDLLTQASSDDVVLLANGCLCCSVRGDLLQALQRLWARHLAALPERQATGLGGQAQSAGASGESAAYRLRAVLIETTGLADPGPILRSLAHDPWIRDRFSFAGIVCTLDAVHGARTLKHYPEAQHQLAVADDVLVTKLDVTQGQLDPELQAHALSLNPIARWLYGRDAALQALLRRVWPGGPHPDPGSASIEPIPERGRSSFLRPIAAARQAESNAEAPGVPHRAGISSFVLIRDDPLPQAAFAHWLDMVIASRGEDLLRVKGWVHLAEHPDQPWIIHGVQHQFSAPERRTAWPGADRRTRLVFITRGLDAETLGDTLDVLVRRHQRAARPPRLQTTSRPIAPNPIAPSPTFNNEEAS